jgi:hypothetical protein
VKFTQAGTIATELPPEADVVDFIDGDGTATDVIKVFAEPIPPSDDEVLMGGETFSPGVEVTRQEAEAITSEIARDIFDDEPLSDSWIDSDIDDEEYMQIVEEWELRCQEWGGKCLNIRIKHADRMDDLKRELISLDKLVEDRRQSLKEAQAERKQCLSDLMDGERNGPELPKKPECISYADFLKMKEAAGNDPIAIAGVINSEPNQDEEWKSVPTSKIFEGKTIKGLGPKKVEAVCDVAPTLGELEDLRNQASLKHLHFCKMLPKGIGEELADAIQDLMYPHTYPNKG